MKESHVFSEILMDTLVTIEVVDDRPNAECADRIDEAFSWFRKVEEVTSRFDPQSELMHLCHEVAVPVEASPLLFRLIEFALAVAEESQGAFDPTVGRELEARGFDRNYLTGARVSSLPDATTACTYRDVVIDKKHCCVTLLKPMVIDLGAVAKGLAMDLAGQALAGCDGYAIDAGGDVLVHGPSLEDAAWRIGIQHPRQTDALLAALSVSDSAVCTSGDYERPGPSTEGGHHIIDPRTGRSPSEAVSVTVVAPTAMVADALSTAAFVLGPDRGIEFLEQNGVEGLIIAGDLVQYRTQGFSRYVL